MNIQQIIKEYLREHGYDGLCNGVLECGCLLNDFAPCYNPSPHCEPGYEAPLCGMCRGVRDPRGEECPRCGDKLPAIQGCVKEKP